MAVGTLRDQVIYPDSHTEQLRKGVKDQELADILEKVRGSSLERRRQVLSHLRPICSTRFC